MPRGDRALLRSHVGAGNPNWTLGVDGIVFETTTDTVRNDFGPEVAQPALLALPQRNPLGQGRVMGKDEPVLRLVLPKGSLEKATLDLFASADLAVTRSSAIDYRASIDDPRIDTVRILRPQEIAGYVAEGLFDLGITGRDWIEETASDVISVGELHYSKVSDRPVRVVVAVAQDSPFQSAEELPHGTRVSSEYPELTRRFFEKRGIDADIRLSYGATEAKVPDIVDCIVDMTETGGALRAAGLKIIDTILVSYTELIANPVSYAVPAKAHAMHQIRTLLEGTMEARGKVLVKLNVSAADLDAVIELLPSMKAPTVSQLFGDAGYAVEAVVPKGEINVLIPALKDHGASDIIEVPLSKIVH
ncbi:MAG: ATP phosphoribosyltransferase [Acidimicrobiales bacterium]